ncbi:hypothetical protein LLG46_06535 [bacterium]|nr:hypothetical protein [bacterium]
MTDERDMEGRTPAQERAQIGTPAGETPEKGRTRHGTYGLTSEEDVEKTHRRGFIGLEFDIDEEDLYESGDEISATGGITGTKVTGGVPAGGTQAGGTPSKSEGIPSWEEKS